MNQFNSPIYSNRNTYNKLKIISCLDLLPENAQDGQWEEELNLDL